jgi:transketolase
MSSISFDIHTLDSGLKIPFWSNSRFAQAISDQVSSEVLANACRLNILASIKSAGSGHIGTSFSSVEILIAIKTYLSLSGTLGKNYSQNGVYFSSKGHDAPAIYSVMHMMGELKDDQLFTLRQLDGLPGHPEIETPGIPTNTGSLGMGISKAKGFVHANRLSKKTETVVVILGDGELQEGQIWESLPTAARDKMSELIVVVDGNKIQSDTWVDKTSPLGDLRKRVEGSGWEFRECDGHDIEDLLSHLKSSGLEGKPTFIYANTIKGCGVTFMTELPNNGKFYKFHSGSVPDDLFQDACDELLQRIEGKIHCLVDLGQKPKKELNDLQELRTELNYHHPKERPSSLITKWADFLSSAMAQDERVVILDADLSYDTGTYLAREKFPERYIQAGISEQDMVSMAGTLALKGIVPFVHSFATFLTMRPTEQIFNNATEKTTVVYVGFLAGLLPSPPGFSHQAVTDVGIMASIPGMQIVEPACETELRIAFNFAMGHIGPTYLRMVSLGEIEPARVTESANPGDLFTRRKGSKVAIICSGPILTAEAVKAADFYTEESCAVFSYPFINSPLTKNSMTQLNKFDKVLILENYNSGLGILKQFHDCESLQPEIFSVDVSGIPRNGWNEQVLKFHKLDAGSLVEKLRSI